MTKAQKELLLKDLCMRLPYGVIMHHKPLDIPLKLSHVFADGGFVLRDFNENIYETFTFNDTEYDLPYLRPMSSMTEEEKEEFCYLQDMVIYNTKGPVTADVNTYVDWLLSHHFDFRGLIKMGLALEAPKDMYE